MKFAPEYVSLVLNENFEDAKALFLDPLMAMHEAHLVMLASRGIVSHADARTLRAGLAAIDRDAVRKTAYDGTCEDLFFFIEEQLVQACGRDVAGRLHTARSRNDIDMTLYRMRQREYILSTLNASLRLRGAMVGLADRHRDTVLTLHTHTQPAQPSTVAHYLLAVIEQLERDATRVKAAFLTTNRNPLGACAITGTGFPIDRDLTSRLLGFDGPTGNTYGSIATVDYLLESVGATAVMLTGLGRVVQDLLLWSMAEFRYLRLGDGFVQGSSIMPQKRNPVALEHARAVGSKALGQAVAINLAIHNTPFGDIVDTEDDLQPLVDRMFHDACRALTMVAAALESASFDADRLLRRAREEWVTVTELADTLVREQGLAFDVAHGVARAVVAARAADPQASLAAVVERETRERAGVAVTWSDERLADILCPRHFVDIRTTHGGPSPAVTGPAIEAARDRLTADRAWVEERRGGLVRAADERARELEQL